MSPADKTLLDQFAGAALSGLLACPTVTATPQEIADYSYEYAALMFAARERRLRLMEEQAAAKHETSPLYEEHKRLYAELEELNAQQAAIPGEPCGGLAEHCSNPRHLEYHSIETRRIEIGRRLAEIRSKFRPRRP